MSDTAIEKSIFNVAIIGAGPAGFYTAGALFRHGSHFKVDMYEKLPAPFGLVRYGVAPDHEKIRNVIKVFEKIASDPMFSYFGNITVGRDISIFELKRHYHAIVFCYGTEADRHLQIPGEELKGCHTATEFVGWYNGHPKFQGTKFDLSHPKAVIIGHGNVAMDVARILCSDVDELKKTDISQHALEALSQSKVKEVYVVGRRGPVQATFTPVEIKEMGELAGGYPVVDPKELELNAASQVEIDDPRSGVARKNLEILKSFINAPSNGRERRFIPRFYRTPIAILGKENVEGVKFEGNLLIGSAHAQQTVGTGIFEQIDCGFLLTSIGYIGLPIEGLPFSSAKGLVPNKVGRVVDGANVVDGLYVAGWIKRGPSGTIGINKEDAQDTVNCILEDLSKLSSAKVSPDQDMVKYIASKGLNPVTFIDWKKIDLAEISRGVHVGKPREKFVTVNDMLSAIT